MDDNKVKEFIEMLEKLNKDLEEITKDIPKDLNVEATVSIHRDKDGRASTHIEGTAYAILVALAGLEQVVLKKTHTSDEMFELIKATNIISNIEEGN